MNTYAATSFGAIFIVLLVMAGGCLSTAPATPQSVPVYSVTIPTLTPTPPPVDPIVGSYAAIGAPVDCNVVFYTTNTGHIDCGFFAQRDFNWYAQPTKGHYQVELEGSMYSGTLEPDGNVWSSALPSGTHLERKH